ncbi:MAG: GNAT family N-acetyltransferase [Blastocatellia bacterium]
MSSTALQNQPLNVTLQTLTVANSSLTIERLTDDHKAETLAFLSARPVHTVFLAGFIHDYGLESHRNRGTFYACRNSQGRIEGIAMIGNVILFETENEAALKTFSRVAQGCNFARVILGEQKKVEQFWQHYSRGGQLPRRRHRQLLFEQRWPLEAREPVEGLRQARPADLPLILPVNDKLVFEESGENPLETDPAGFERRWLHRIEQGRVLVWVENGRLIFSVDIICDTPDVVYIEGVYVHPEERGKGYGVRCLSQIGRSWLKRDQSVCLLANEHNTGAHGFYRSAGYKLRGYYETIFLHRKS